MQNTDSQSIQTVNEKERYTRGTKNENVKY